MAAAVGEALDALGHRRAVLMGHSYGTLVASRFAKLYPERVHAMVLLDAGGRGAGVVRGVVGGCGMGWLWGPTKRWGHALRVGCRLKQNHAYVTGGSATM